MRSTEDKNSVVGFVFLKRKRKSEASSILDPRPTPPLKWKKKLLNLEKTKFAETFLQTKTDLGIIKNNTYI